MSINNHQKLRINNIHRYLGEGENQVHILKGISFVIQPSTMYSIVGPSGSGKSTLLYLMGLLDRPDSGEIFINDVNISHASDLVRTQTRNIYIGFVFQFHFLLPEFSAIENVMLPMRKQGTLTKKIMEQRALSLLEDVGLAEKAKRLSTRLSGGEQQRVAIARALANNPRLLLADEPTGNLDAKNSNQVFDLLNKLSHEKGQAVVMVTHNTDLAKQANKTIHMQDGYVLHEETHSTE